MPMAAKLVLLGHTGLLCRSGRGACWLPTPSLFVLSATKCPQESPGHGLFTFNQHSQQQRLPSYSWPGQLPDKAGSALHNGVVGLAVRFWCSVKKIGYTLSCEGPASTRMLHVCKMFFWVNDGITPGWLKLEKKTVHHYVQLWLSCVATDRRLPELLACSRGATPGEASLWVFSVL